MSEIPEDIWEAARALRGAVLWESNSAVEHIARAIMAERERCVKIAEEAASESDWVDGRIEAGQIASAIRSGS